ncbi:MAG: lipoyl synthase [Lentisphaerae bacterium]|nr:lipoyl synthase [Lentisphaerota bacterium]
MPEHAGAGKTNDARLSGFVLRHSLVLGCFVIRHLRPESDDFVNTDAKPPWIRARIPAGPDVERLKRIIERGRLHTVCKEALCPNLGRCWAQGRATVMILGGACSRNCLFCNVASPQASGYDEDEPRRVAEAAREMGLKDIVITSVTRDDLPDGGAALWAETVRAVREAAPGIAVEVLVPDFGGNPAAVDAVVASRPDVFGHNLETVKDLYARVRPRADYRRSLNVLARGHAGGLIVKTGIMVGLGESEEQVRGLMADAREAGAGILTIGQYLRPSRRHLPVDRYVTPEEFEAYRQAGLAAGFDIVVSGPLVRSSYYSPEQAEFVAGRLKKRRRGGSLDAAASRPRDG